MIGLAIQVARCTPLVTWPIGTASHGRPGQSSRQMLRDTWPCRRDTPFTRGASRMRSTVMWNWSRQAGMRAEREERLAVDAHLLPDRAGARSTSCSTANASWPAGTGVCVVKTLCAAHLRDRFVEGAPPADDTRAAARPS